MDAAAADHPRRGIVAHSGVAPGPRPDPGAGPDAVDAVGATLRIRFPETVIDTRWSTRQPCTRIRAAGAVPLLRFLKEEPSLAFDMLSDLSGVDYLGYGGEPERFAVVYQLYATSRNARYRVRAMVSELEPSIETVSGIWKNAAWLEREVYDLFGIRFAGHPDLRRILCPESFTEHPLRKDYPVKGRGERERFPVYRREEDGIS